MDDEDASPSEVDRLLEPPFDEAAAQAFLARLGGVERMAAFIDFVLRRLITRDHRSVFWGDRMMTLDKAAGFLQDKDFMRAWDKVRGAHVYDQYDNVHSIAWRLHTLVWAARQALQLPSGDFVECGVFQGDMSFVVYESAGLADSDRRLHLFDSFEGLDPEQVAPGEYASSPGYFDMANSYYRKPGLYEGVLAKFEGRSNVHVHRGFLPGALAGAAPGEIAWLHVDLNSAIAEVGVLEALFDRLVPGGLVVLDDYGWSAYGMQKSAEDAFFAERGYQVLELPTGQGLVVKRPDGSKSSSGWSFKRPWARR